MSNLTTKLIGTTPVGGVVEAEAIDFDGTNDYLSRSTDLVGNADGKTFTFSAWVYFDESGSYRIIQNTDGTNEGLLIYAIMAAGEFQFKAYNSAGGFVLDANFLFTPSLNTFYHIIGSFDMTNTSNRHVYLNDENVTSSVDFSTYANDNIDFTKANHEIGGNTGGGSKMDGRLSNVFLDYTYRDLSVESNRRNFITDDLKPADGQAALSPILYLPMDDPADPGRNDGTGGDFTLNGTVARSGRGPDQYNAAASTFDGSADYLSRSSITGAPTSSKVLTASFCVKPNLIQNQYVGSILGTRTRFKLDSSGNIEFDFKNTSGSSIFRGYFNMEFTRPYLDRWSSVQISIDMDDQSKLRLFLDGEEYDFVVQNFNSGQSIDTDFDSSFIGSFNSSGNFLNGELSEVYADTVYTDLRTENPFLDSETGKHKPVRQVLEETGNTPLIAMPLRADDAGNNLGTGGDFTVNSGPYTGARGPSEYWGESAEFNGTDQRLERTSAVTGSTSTVVSMAVAWRVDDPSLNNGIFYVFDGSNYFDFAHEGGNLRIRNSDGFDINIVESGFRTTEWLVALLCLDTSDPTKSYLFVDGVDRSISHSISAALPVNGSTVYVGEAVLGKMDGKIGFLWFDTTYIDFSQEANRLKFFDAFNYPVDLGEDGSLPTGNQPLIYMNNDFHLGTNLGSGGDFTPQNGPTDGGFVKG